MTKYFTSSCSDAFEVLGVVESLMITLMQITAECASERILKSVNAWWVYKVMDFDGLLFLRTTLYV